MCKWANGRFQFKFHSLNGPFEILMGPLENLIGRRILYMSFRANLMIYKLIYVAQPKPIGLGISHKMVQALPYIIHSLHSQGEEQCKS